MRFVVPVAAALLALGSASGARAADKNGVSPQTISLPSGPGSIEGLGESFEPQLNTGTASWGVPIELPPGRKGMAPALRLAYEGGAGSGPLGIGWRVSGIAFVQRQTDKGLPRYDESASFTGSDTFTTSEGEELVPLSDGTYRAENEGGFRRYHFDRAANVWTCEHPDGAKTTFGADPFSRIEAPGRTARWYATRVEDTNGNRIEFEYVPFSDSPGQVYPSRIYYTRHATQTLAGEHVVAFDWAPRPDPVHDFRFGFELTTGRRLERIDLCTRGGSFTPASLCDGIGVPGAARVRSYQIEYDDVGACQASVCTRGLVGAPCAADAQCTVGASRLERVTQIGDDGVSALPSLELGYTDLELLASPSGPTWQLVAGYPAAVAGSAESALVDLNADGLPDVLESPTAQPGVLRRWLNAGSNAAGIVVFGSEETFAGPVERLSTAGTQLADLDGDGITDLVTRPSPTASQFDLHRGTGAGAFAPTSIPYLVAGLDSFSTGGFEDPSVRLVDLDFDKRIDVLRTVTSSGITTELRARLSLRVNGQDLLAPQTSCAAIAQASFADGKTFLVDMNGDRLLDVVVVQTSAAQVDQILYYPATGRGGYGIGGSCATAGVPVIVGGDAVAGVPGADFTSFRGFRFEDLSGDGQADLLYTGPAGLTLWINRGGDALRRIELGPWPAGLDYDACAPGCNPLLFDVIEIADLNGNGTPDVVLVDRESATVRYLDLVGPTGVPPNLLARIDNGIGAVTTIEYEPSTRDYLDAQAAGAVPWRTRTPFPVAVVSAKKVRFGLDLDGVPGEDEYRTDYRYRDAFYDGIEKEFRGFSEVEAIARGDASEPTLLTRYSFHTGSPDGVDNDADGLVDERSTEGGAEEESLKGMSLEVRRETCADGPDGACATPGAIFDHAFSRWQIQTLYGATGARCSGDPTVGCCTDSDCATADLGGACVAGANEAGLFPARSCVAGKSIHWAVATAQRTALIEGGSGPRKDLLTETDYDGFGNSVASREWGVVDADAPPPFGCLLAGGTCSLAPQQTCGSDSECVGAGVGTCVKESASDGTPCSGDPFAFTNPADPIDERFESRSWAINESAWLLRCPQQQEVANAASVVESRSRSFYDDLPLGQCVRGNETRLENELLQESRWISTLRTTYDPYGNPIERRDARDGLRSFEYDAGFRSFATRETAHLAYPLSATATYHEGLGTPRSVSTWAVSGIGPVSQFERDAFGRLSAEIKPGDSAAAPTRQWVYRLNEQGDGVNALELHQREDPGGGTIDSTGYFDGLGRSLGRTAEGSSPSEWVVEDVVAYGRRGSVRASWNPRFSTTASYELPLVTDAHSVLRYDSLDRMLEADHPDGEALAVLYKPLLVERYDENDVAGLTPAAFSTERNDGLSRLAEVVERTGSETFSTLYRWDARGNLTEIEDPHGNVAMLEYDALSRLTSGDDPDRGTMQLSYDDAGNLVETVDAAQRRIVFTYDEANRRTSQNYLDVSGDPATDPVDVVLTYDLPPAEPVDLGGGTFAVPAFGAGELVSVTDASGAEHRSYDARRRVAWKSKQVLDPLVGAIAPYASEFTYDSADRVTSMTYPDGDVVEYEYGARGSLARISGPGGGLNVADAIEYTPSGQVARIAFGNATETEMSYDDRLRVQSVRTTGAGATLGMDLIHYQYTRDPASNPTLIADLRPQVPPGSDGHDTQRLEYDALQRLVNYRLSSPTDENVDSGSISYAYDALDNLVMQTSTISHEVSGRSVTDLGTLQYGGAAGTFGRIGRAPGAPPGPHAVTSAGSGPEARSYAYDANGNVTVHDGRSLSWDFENRLVSFEDAMRRADYRYDHTGRRVTKRVEWKQDHGVARAGDAERTIYVDESFEIRAGGQATKFVLLDGKAIAEISGTISPTAQRVQWFDLLPGWNLVAISVTASDTAARLGIGTSAIGAAWRWEPSSSSFSPVGPTTPLPAGAILWLHAEVPACPSVRGVPASFPDPELLPAGAFVSPPALESLPIPSAIPVGGTAWLWDSLRGRWRGQLADPLTALGDAPAHTPRSSPLFARAQDAAVLLTPPSGARVRFRHADPLRSSVVVTDADGALVEDLRFYPYGLVRVRTTGLDRGLPSSERAYLDRELDAESGLYALGARYYDPIVRSFTSVDPVHAMPIASTQPRRANAYGYGLANPLLYVDDTGLSPDNPEGPSAAVSRFFRGMVKTTVGKAIRIGGVIFSTLSSPWDPDPQIPDHHWDVSNFEVQGIPEEEYAPKPAKQPRVPPGGGPDPEPNPGPGTTRAGSTGSTGSAARAASNSETSVPPRAGGAGSGKIGAFTGAAGAAISGLSFTHLIISEIVNRKNGFGYDIVGRPNVYGFYTEEVVVEHDGESYPLLRTHDCGGGCEVEFAGKY